ncbi:FAD-binding oxidoreductase [Acidocella sp.]|uniref:NAD(P)/FAD-dependent oxidoreductase n=1 Tax=Acidocella sp. TaxID=50710 RepID=UPI002619844D|nr:FAD-dependent oxidoreductase [Acidocella sp.]
MSDKFDVIIVGAGMVGASVAAALGSQWRAAIVETEAQAGYHTTGRSAAIWVRNYGPQDVRVLTGLSADFYHNPPADIGTDHLAVGREILYLAPAGQEQNLDGLIGQGLGVEEISLARAKGLCPAIRDGYAVRAALETDGFDMDVAALHQYYLRRAKAAGGQLMLRNRADRIERRDGLWHVHTAGGLEIAAPILVNAAGAWGDEVAEIAGLRPLGLVPCRRTAAIIDPAPWQVEHWPMVQSAGHDWYVRTEARTRLMVTPCDETPMPPHDVHPDDLDVAIGIDRMQQALDIEVRRVEHSWAGLRTFSPDRSLAFGFDRDAEGFFWCVGQGGYGIQTAPAASALVAAMIKGEDPGEAGAVIAAIDPMRFR